MSWIKNYEPDNIKDFIGNKTVINNVLTWMNNFYAGTLSTLDSNSIIISGPHGIGKSLCVKLILKKMNCYYKFLDSNQSKNQETFDDFKKYVKNKGSIHNIMLGEKCDKFALVIDDSENISLNSEKNSILSLHKENLKKRMFPIIFITSTQHSKMISDIKKKHNNEYCLEEPKTEELYRFIEKIKKDQKFNFESSEIIDSIIEFSQYDVRRLINIMNDLKLTFGENVINNSSLLDYFNTSKLKKVDIGLFDATKMTLNKFSSIQDTLMNYELEKVLLPLMVFENYKNKLFSQNVNIKETLERSKIISEHISTGDIIETNIYTDQNWYLQNIHGFYTCCVPAFYLNHNIETKDNYAINFSCDLNKTSSRNINKKNFNILKTSVLNLSTFDILHINKVFYHLANNEQYDRITELIKTYGIDVKNLEILVKIDKTVENKIQFSAKTRKSLQKMLMEI